MAYVRKPSPRSFKDGGRVPISEPLPIADEIDPDEAVRRAIEAQRHAEELARAAQRRQESLTADEYVDGLTYLSDQKRAFLKANPDILLPEKSRIVSQRYAEALAAGIADDTPEMYEHLLNGVRREEPPMSPVIEKQPASPPPAPPAPLPPIRKSMPVTAPVTRDIPSLASGRRESKSSVTLSPEEVRIARTSFSDPTGKMTNADKEREYAENKLKLRRLREAGKYPMPERN